MPNSKPSGFPPQFYKYWGPGGTGGNLIQWDTPGDFMRCVHEINAKIEQHGGHPLPDPEIKGLCNHLHETYTGAAPGHGPAERAAGEAEKRATRR